MVVQGQLVFQVCGYFGQVFVGFVVQVGVGQLVLQVEVVFQQDIVVECLVLVGQWYVFVVLLWVGQESDGVCLWQDILEVVVWIVLVSVEMCVQGQVVLFFQDLVVDLFVVEGVDCLID